MQIVTPPAFNKQHEIALTVYLHNPHGLDTAVWQQLYQAIDFLSQAQVIMDDTHRTFHQVYGEYVDRVFADQYIDQLVALQDVSKESPALTAVFARQIGPALEKANLLHRGVPQSWLLLAYCVYWWQSFARGYAFEVEIMRDLAASNIQFQMHDIQRRTERYSSADLIVLDLLGDIKTSTYFLHQEASSQLSNDFYITRLYEKGHERILVVFQKPFAWQTVGGGKTISGKLDTLFQLLPKPVRLEQYGIMFVVVDYNNWKQLVLRKQAEIGASYV